MRRGIGGAAAAASGYVYYKKRTDEGFSRALRLYSVGGPVVAAYRFEEWKQKSSLSPFKMSEEEKSAAWKALDEKHAERIVQPFDELQGMYTKYGQTCAGMSNTFSPLWIEKLRKLEDGVTPRSTKVVMQTIEEEFGKPASEIFSEFDDVLLGSASIGQVHRAVVRATGKEVAVKVQYPESQRLFAEDMKTIRSFFTIAAPEQLIILNEMERSANREFDYARRGVEPRDGWRQHGRCRILSKVCSCATATSPTHDASRAHDGTVSWPKAYGWYRCVREHPRRTRGSHLRSVQGQNEG